MRWLDALSPRSRWRVAEACGYPTADHVHAYQMIAPQKPKLARIRKLSYAPGYGRPLRFNAIQSAAATTQIYRIAG